ncbi:thermonuclease family protein [Aminobacter sp. BE322]|uniref:thermonuclease family protein n=1 Tax=unclassified Aminobacter TaxID=2644704 RepID=UPI003D1E5D28
MKPAALAFAALGFGLAVAVVSAGGQRLAALEAPSLDTIDESDLPADLTENFDVDSTAAVAPTETAPDAASGGPVAEETGQAALDPARPVAKGEFAPPATEAGGLTREAPRAPLSELSLALPPKPKMNDEWDGATLFRPVASAAGRIEAMGLGVTIAGLVPLEEGESCTADGQEWNCSARARTAFRGFLRGRAVVCDVPPEKTGGEAVAKCRIGKMDVGEWLVANGWARAEAGGPYEDAGRKAEADKKGIFGPPPDTAGSTD